MKRATSAALLLASGSFLWQSVQPACAEDINEIFKKVNDYVAKENFPKAIEELGWAKKEIEKLNSQKIGKLLPNEVNGFTGDAPKIQSALGFTTIERNYTNGGKTIVLNLAGGAGGAGGALGGLAGLAKMGMMMEGADGTSDTFRIDGRTANLSTQGGSPELTLFLDSGQILKLEARGGVDAAQLKTFAEQLKVTALDEYLKGSGAQPSN